MVATTIGRDERANRIPFCLAAALSKPAELNALYERYFVGEKTAQLTAGNYWNQYDES
jgi:hypothetical protein